MIIPLDHIQQQLDSVKTEWVDLRHHVIMHKNREQQKKGN